MLTTHLTLTTNLHHKLILTLIPIVTLREGNVHFFAVFFFLQSCFETNQIPEGFQGAGYIQPTRDMNRAFPMGPGAFSSPSTSTLTLTLTLAQ